MDNSIPLPSPPPSGTNSTDDANSEPVVSANAPHHESMVSPKLQQVTTYGTNGNDDNAAVLPKLAHRETQLDNESVVHSAVRSAKVKAPSTILVSHVEAQHMGIIKIIQMQRPDAKNALSRQMVRELGDEVEKIHRETCDDGTSTRALVIASAVDKVFCGGADLKERAVMSLSDTRNFLSALRNVLYRLSTLPVPAIACVSGLALGGGLELALSCHLRVFASDAVVGLPETRLAIVPGAGGTYRLPRVVGTSRALDMILTGRRVHAEEALAMGLCHRLVPVNEEKGSDPEAPRLSSLDAGIALARQITGGGPAAVRAALGVLNGAHDALENAAYESILFNEDRQEALQAFLEKRASVFQGH